MSSLQKSNLRIIGVNITLALLFAAMIGAVLAYYHIVLTVILPTVAPLWMGMAMLLSTGMRNEKPT